MRRESTSKMHIPKGTINTIMRIYWISSLEVATKITKHRNSDANAIDAIVSVEMNDIKYLFIIVIYA
jgi:hypothetical protein